MKLNTQNKTTLLAAILMSGMLNAQTIVPAPGVIVQGDATVEGDATVNGLLEVTLPDVEPATPVINNLPDDTPLPATINADNEVNVRSEEIRRVSVDGVDVIRQGGATVDPLGNTILAQRETQVDTVSYSIIRTFDVDADGVEIPLTQRFYAARPDTANPGSFIALTREEFDTVPVLDVDGNQVFDDDGNPVTEQVPRFEPITFSTFVDAEAFVNTEDFDSAVFTEVTTSADPVIEGGNLTVEGLTTTNGINNSGAKITNIANGTAATDAASVGQVAAADTAIRGEFAAADTALGGRITAETSARTSADVALGGRIDAETATRISQDAAIRSEFAAADTAIRSEFAAADAAIRNDFTAADRRLQSQIDENTRGIAMVAAMTNTRVEAGKTHGVDFNIAQFQSETGFAFGYANRINDSVQLHCAIASTTDMDESVGRIGVAFQW